MVRSTTAATATARPVLTTSPPDPAAPSFAGVEHPFLSLRGRTAFLSLRGREAAEAISWHGDRHAPSGLAMTDGQSLRGRTAFSVIARPRSGRSNLLAWGSPRPFGARDDRKVSHCEAR